MACVWCSFTAESIIIYRIGYWRYSIFPNRPQCKIPPFETLSVVIQHRITQTSSLSWKLTQSSTERYNYQCRLTISISRCSILFKSWLWVLLYPPEWSNLEKVVVCLTHICQVDRSILIIWTSAFPILGVSGVPFILFLFYFEYTFLLANSEVLDQTPRSAASDLGLHCLPTSQKWDAMLIWVKDAFDEK